MKDKEKTTLQTVLDNFIGELTVLAEAYPESDFDEFLIEEVAPELTKDDQVFGTSVFRKLDIAVELSKLESETRSNSLEGAMYRMDSDEICWILDHIHTLDEVDQHLHYFLSDIPSDKDAIERLLNSVRNDRNRLQNALNSDLYERIQGYVNDIQKLKEDS